METNEQKNVPPPPPIPAVVTSGTEKASKKSLVRIVWHQTSLAAKLAAIALVTLILWIPACVVEHLIDERASRQEEVVREIASKWGARQLIVGPIFSVNGKHSILPETLNVTGEISPEIRHRGIFQTVIYTAKLTFSGTFSQPADACTIAMSDIRGVRSAEIKINGKSYPFKPMKGKNLAAPVMPAGVGETSGVSLLRFPPNTSGEGPDADGVSGLLRQIGVDFEVSDKNNEQIPYELTLSLQGTESLLIDPLGKFNKITLKSDWASPGFTGASLPGKREVRADGFTAEWELSDLNTGYQREWDSNSFAPGKMASGVALTIPADTYQQTRRATRYAVLFIGIFLFTMLLAEVLTKLEVCMIQYIIAGCAPVVFYLLLLSLGEHTGFSIGYLIASAATVALSAFYCALIFRKRLAVIGISAMLAASYGIMYLILRMEDIALLAGSIAVFVILAVLMGITGGLNKATDDTANS